MEYFTAHHFFIFAKTWMQMRITVKLNSDSGICEHNFRKVCGQRFFEQSWALR